VTFNGTPREQGSRVAEGRQCVDHAGTRGHAREELEKGSGNVESSSFSFFGYRLPPRDSTLRLCVPPSDGIEGNEGNSNVVSGSETSHLTDRYRWLYRQYRSD